MWSKAASSPRIAAVPESFVWLVLLLALAVSVASGPDGLKLFGIEPRRAAYHAISRASRYSGSASCVICSCCGLFTLVFPRSVPRNVVRHAFLLTAYFAVIAAGFPVMNLLRGSAPLVGALMTGSSAGLCVLWGVLLSEGGEQIPAAAPAVLQPEA